MSFIKILNNNDPNIEPYQTPFTRLYQELQENPIFVHYAHFH